MKKMSLCAFAAVLSITVLSTTHLTTYASRSHTTAPPSVSVNVTPTRLAPLDRATIAATFSSDRPVAGPYTATLELRPHSRGRAVPAGHDVLTATQGAFRLHHGQPLSVYWEWRAGATLPPGAYTVRVRLSDVTRQVVASGTAPASLVIVRHP
jgi:hypothetical protein